MSDILIITGSKSDSEYVDKATEVLDEFGVSYDASVSSAHRQPEKTRELASNAESRGYKVIIAMAGYSAALPGAAASHSNLPIIGVPLPTSDMKGIDAALSILQMPGGVPVGSTGIGKSGAKNAALLAIRILAVFDPTLKEKLRSYKDKLARG